MEDRQGSVEGELALVSPAVRQEQGAGLNLVASLEELGGGSLDVPAPLLVVGEQVGAEGGVEGRGHAAHQEPSVQQEGEKLRVTARGVHLTGERRPPGYTHANAMGFVRGLFVVRV